MPALRVHFIFIFVICLQLQFHVFSVSALSIRVTESGGSGTELGNFGMIAPKVGGEKAFLGRRGGRRRARGSGDGAGKDSARNGIFKLLWLLQIL